MKLYSYFRSSAAFRLRIALNLKGIEYEYAAIDLLAGEQKSEEYLAENPLGLVPAMQLPDGEVLGQSVALLEWLDETHPEPALLPASASEKARVRAMVNTITCDIHPICNIAVTEYLKANHNAQSDDILIWFDTWMRRGFTAIEKTLQNRNSSFAFGEEPGMAEICLVPQAYNARRYRIDLDAFPHMTALIDQCNEIPAFRDAAPELQPDSPS